MELEAIRGLDGIKSEMNGVHVEIKVFLFYGISGITNVCTQ